MSNRPSLGLSNFTLDGFMNNSQPVRMRASAWVNPSKDDKFDQAKLAIVEQVKQLIIENNLQISVRIDAKHGDDVQNWPKIGNMTLFANRPRDDQQPAPQPPQQYQQPPQQGYQQPPQQYQPAPAAPAAPPAMPPYNYG